MAEKKILSTVTKTLLKNVIRHTDSHNKVVEESEMWRQRKREKHSSSSDYSFLNDRRLDMNYEFQDSRERRAHMDEEPHSSTYWMKELYKAEEADNNRWGHSGFKELYPEKFDPTSSSSSEESSHRKHKDRHKKEKKLKAKSFRKRKHSNSNTDSDPEETKKKKKHKKRHKHKDGEKKKKRKHKKSRHKDDSDSG